MAKTKYRPRQALWEERQAEKGLVKVCTHVPEDKRDRFLRYAARLRQDAAVRTRG